MATTLNKTLPDLSKLEPLDGNNYKRWSQKLLIFVEQLEVNYVLFNDPPADIVANSSNAANTITVDDATKKKFEKDNKTVRGHLLNYMTNPLFDLFINYKSAEVIWDGLEKKYDVDDAGKKKNVVGKWIKFQMADDKPIMEQVHEYENLIADVLNEGMEMCEILQANVLLEKFPPSWSDYRNQLKHKKKKLTLQELISHMRTKEANRLKDEESERLKDKMKSLSLNSSKANLVEFSITFVKDRFKIKQNKGHVKKQDYFNKPEGHIQKSKGPCYVCGKIGHRAFQCNQRQGQSSKNGGKAPVQANLTEGGDVIAVVVVEANMVANKTD
uniref:Uncharacterized protein LOC104242843 n=1 Tax=Nicotiana sylvestris TaxID=4096 RepID=A0A1U7XZE0_NICSY|nr:PREDICTED: uncharacterized protein LOC104242843 [Nicotiana sylvestris]